MYKDIFKIKRFRNVEDKLIDKVILGKCNKNDVEIIILILENMSFSKIIII